MNLQLQHAKLLYTIDFSHKEALFVHCGSFMFALRDNLFNFSISFPLRSLLANHVGPFFVDFGDLLLFITGHYFLQRVLLIYLLASYLFFPTSFFFPLLLKKIQESPSRRTTDTEPN